MTTGVNVGRVEGSQSLDVSRKSGIILLRQHVLHQSGVSESIHDPWDEVAPEAVPFREVEHEVRRGEGSILYAATSRAACDVESVLFCSGLDVFTVTAETSLGVEDVSLEDFRGVGAVRFCVKRPVPVPAGRSTMSHFGPVLLVGHTADHQCIHTLHAKPSRRWLRSIDARG
jgi:hypothetical protein